MSLEAIKNLNVKNVAAKDSILFLWITNPFLEHAFETMRQWGFKYKTVGFTWAKLIKNHEVRNLQDKWKMGNGYYTRANPELVLIGTRGKILKRLDKSVRNLVIEPIGKHSEKPEEVQNRIEQLYGKKYNMLELFARRKRKHWTCIGSDLDMTVESFLDLDIIENR